MELVAWSLVLHVIPLVREKVSVEHLLDSHLGTAGKISMKLEGFPLRNLNVGMMGTGMLYHNSLLQTDIAPAY